MQTPSRARSGSSVSTALSDASEVVVSGRNKGIQAIDLGQVFSSDDARVLTLITCFDLSHNEMEVLANLERMTSLRKLNVSYNRIGRVSGLPLTITQLNLAHNRVSHLEGVAHLPHLWELDVSFNRLTSLIGLSPRLPLEVLHADDNRLVSTAGLEDLAQLRVLTLSNNFISSADELVFLSSTPSLQILNAQGNPVTRQTSYRGYVHRLQPAVLSLDGAPLLSPREVPAPSAVRHHSVDATPTAARVASRPTPLRGGRQDVSPPAHGASRTVTPAQQALSPPRRQGMAPIARSSAHLVVTPSASKVRADPAGPDTSVESETPEANANAPLPTGHRDAHGGRTQSPAATSYDDSQPVVGTFTPSGRGSYARQFAAAKQQRRQPQSRQEALTVHAPWTRPSSDSPSDAGARVPDAVARAPSVEAPAAPASVSSLLRPADVQRENAHTAQLHDSLVARELLARENEQLRGMVKRLEAQLADSRRVVSDQLAELSRTRLERDALRQSEEELKARCERAKRAGKMQESHHRDELLTLQSQYERVKTFYETELADLRRQLATELRRSRGGPTPHGGPSPHMSSTTAEATAQQFLPPPPPLAAGAAECAPSPPSSPPTVEGRVAHAATTSGSVSGEGGTAQAGTASVPHRTHSTQTLSQPAPLRAASLGTLRTARRASSQDGGISPLSDTAPRPAPGVLANQLKGWLYTEMAADAGKAQEEAILSQLRSSIDTEEEADHRQLPHPTAVSPHQASEARALLEAFVTRQLAASTESACMARGADSGFRADSTDPASRRTSPEPTAADGVLDGERATPDTTLVTSPDAKQPLPPAQAASVSTSTDAGHGLRTPQQATPPPLPLSAPADTHTDALRQAQSFLGAAASRLDVAGARAPGAASFRQLEEL